jgi:RimJ/RimL family protein N-acetyltransferase
MALQVPKICDGFMLRPFTHADAVPLSEIELDPEVKRFLALSDNNKAQWLREFDPNLQYHLAVEVDGHIAGRVSILNRMQGVGELVIIIGRTFWGKGLGRTVAAEFINMVFIDLNAKAIQAVVHPEHHASLNLLKAFKFRRHGTVNGTVENPQTGYLRYQLSRGAYFNSNERAATNQPVAAAHVER